MVVQKRIGWLMIACLVWVSCGYRFSGSGKFPSGIGSVFVEIFENRTLETGVENIFTNDLIYEVTRRGGVRLAGKDDAESTLSGVISGMGTETVSRKGLKDAAERRLRVRVDLKLVDRSGKVIWSAVGVPATETYAVEGDKTATEENQKAAIERLSKRLAEIIYNRMTSDF